jgi:hypothetical protein
VYLEFLAYPVPVQNLHPQFLVCLAHHGFLERLVFLALLDLRQRPLLLGHLLHPEHLDVPVHLVRQYFHESLELLVDPDHLQFLEFLEFLVLLQFLALLQFPVRHEFLVYLEFHYRHQYLEYLKFLAYLVCHEFPVHL